MPEIKGLSNLLKRALTDRSISREEVGGLIAEVRRNGTLSNTERTSLEQALRQHASAFTPEAKTALGAFLGTLPGPTSATSLGTWNGVAVSLGTDGRFGLGGAAPASLGDELKAMRTALLGAGEAGPFATVSDPSVLRSASVAAARLFDSCLRTPRNDGEALTFRQGRAAALATLEAAAVQARASGNAELADGLTFGLVESIRKEPHQPLRAFALDSATTRSAAGKLPDIKGAASVLYPEKPPYDAWLKDGKIKFAWYTDNDGSPREDNLQFFRDLGFKEKQEADGSTTFTLSKRGENRIEVNVRPAPSHDAPPSLFEKMADADVDVITYCGHAGYGRRVEDALARGVGGTGENKLAILMQCSGEGSIESIHRAYPDAQLISTRALTDDNLDFTMLEGLMNALRTGDGWGQVRKDTISSFESWRAEDGETNSYDTFDIGKHYFFPHDREVLLGRTDRDRDGVRDNGDHVFNVIFPGLTDAAGGMNAVVPTAPSDALDGGALNRAIERMNLVGRDTKVPAELVRNVAWGEHAFSPDGFFEPQAGDLRAFQFEVDGASKQIKVKLSTHFSHASADALGRMMAVESGLFLGRLARADAPTQSALALSLLERAVHQAGSSHAGGYYGDFVESPQAQEQLLRARYGLGPTFAELLAASGNPDDFTEDTFRTLLERTRGATAWSEIATRDPRPASEPMRIPSGVRLAGSLNGDALTQLAQRLGLEGRVTSTWASVPTGRASRLTLDVTGTAGPEKIVLALDSEGNVLGASRFASPAAPA
jgi:hypothetical protein